MREEKSRGRTAAMNSVLSTQMKDIFAEFGAIRDSDPAGASAQELVKKLQDFITEHFYPCSDETLRGLGLMYAGCGDFTANIDGYAGEGAAEFAYRAIDAYYKDRNPA